MMQQLSHQNQLPPAALIGVLRAGGHMGVGHVHWIFHPLALRGGAGDTPQGLSAVHPGNRGLGRAASQSWQGHANF